MSVQTGKSSQTIQTAQTDKDNQVLLEAGMALRTLSHFAKNILQMVGGAAEVANLSLQRNDIQRLRQSAGLLTGNVDRLKRLTMDLCEYSKLRPMQCAPCQINDLVQKAVKTLPAGMDTLTDQLQLSLPVNLPEIYIDPEKVTQMIRHILVHVLDAIQTPDDKVRLETCWMASQQEIQICVSAPIELPQPHQAIFEPVEYKNTRFRTGLNLPLALRLVNQHEGRIELEPLGNGTVNLLVCLPTRKTI